MGKYILRGVAALVFCTVDASTGPNGDGKEYIIYDDATTWQIKGSSNKPPMPDPNQSEIAKSGKAIATNGHAIRLVPPTPVSTSGFDRIEFWAHGGKMGTGAKRYGIYVEGNTFYYGRLQRYMWIVSGRWEKYSVPLRFIGNPAEITSIAFIPDGWGGEILIDDLKLSRGSHESYLPVPQMPEILIDGDFEDGANGQYTMGCKVECVTSPVKSGKYSLRVYDRPMTKGSAWTGPDFEPTPFYYFMGPGWYEVSGWFKLPDGATRTANCSIGFEVIYCDPDDGKHGTLELKGSSSAKVGTEWTQVKYQKKIGTGRWLQVLKVLPMADDETGEYFLDAVSVKKIPDPDAPDDFGKEVNLLKHVPVDAMTEDVEKLFKVEVFGGKGSNPGEFNFPRGIALDASGALWVADTDQDRLQKFENGAWKIIGKSGAGDGEFHLPRRLTFDSNGGMYVFDAGNRRIMKNEGGAWSLVYTMPANNYTAYSETQKNGPRPADVEDLVFVPGVGLCVIDICWSRLWQKKDDGWGILQPINVVQGDKYNTKGMSAGLCDLPQGICYDGKGGVYMADTGNHRIQYRAPDGGWKILAGISAETVKCFVPEGYGASSKPGEFNLPKSVALAPDGTLYVADSGNHRIQMRDAATGKWTAFGKQGIAPGEFDGPEYIAVDAKGTIYVADTRNHRIQMLKKK